MVQYNCICCSYKTDRKLNYTRHMSSKLHLKCEKGLETQSEDKKLFEANQIIKKLTEDNANLLNTIKRLNALVDHKEEDTKPNPTPLHVIGGLFNKSYINKEQESRFDLERNDLVSIVSMDYKNITNPIPIVDVYMRCLIDSTLDPLKGFISKHFKPKDYAFNNKNEIVFYDTDITNDDPEKRTNLIEYSIGKTQQLRKRLAKEIRNCDNFYKEYINMYRREDQQNSDILSYHTAEQIDFDIFSKIIIQDKKNEFITKEFFIECLR